MPHRQFFGGDRCTYPRPPYGQAARSETEIDGGESTRALSSFASSFSLQVGASGAI